MGKAKLNDSEEVKILISNLNDDVKEIVEAIRNIILSTDAQISEQVKWNSPSFYFTGEMKVFDAKEYKRDIVVCNLHRGKILLVFPTGAKVKDELNGKDYPDGRKIITITNLADVETKTKALQQLIIQWLAMVDK